MTPPLTPEAVAQMVADREAGTPGPWVYEYTRVGHTVRQPGAMDRIFGSNNAGAPEIDARRIARLPDLEAAYLTLAAENATLRQERDDYRQAYEDTKRLARMIDVALHGEDGAAKQASLCDLVAPAATLRHDYDMATVTAAKFMADAVQRLETAERANATLRGQRDHALDLSGKSHDRECAKDDELATLRASEAAALAEILRFEILVSNMDDAIKDALERVKVLEKALRRASERMRLATGLEFGEHQIKTMEAWAKEARATSTPTADKE